MTEREFDTFEAQYNGELKKFKVYVPDLSQQRDAMKIRNRTFADAVESGALLKTQLLDIMRERKLWDDAKQARYTEIEQKLTDGKKRLEEGGFKLNEAKELAIQMRDWRDELVEMKLPESQLANETAEGQAENTSFNYLVSVCTVYNDTEQPVFEGLDDYLNHATDEISIKASKCLAALTFGLKSDLEKQLPENEFLLEYGFVDENLEFPQEEPEEVVEEKIEKKPFLDDDGNAIPLKQKVDDQVEVEEEKAEPDPEESQDDE